MQDFTRILAWQKAQAQANNVRILCIRHRKNGYGDLSEQMRKSASSVASNISEGAACKTNAEFAKFLHDALESNGETKRHLMESRDTCFLPARLANKLIDRNNEVGRLPSSFTRSVETELDEKEREESRKRRLEHARQRELDKHRRGEI